MRLTKTTLKSLTFSWAALLAGLLRHAIGKRRPMSASHQEELPILDALLRNSKGNE